jgi:hypothetical protein
MPNTLAHIGAQGLLTRWVIRDLDPRWILLGCVIPDVPWIANRAVQFLLPGLDPITLRLYFIAQASLLCSLLLCGALAVLANRWRDVFLLLSLNSVLHLVLDACQTKWGNGVHLLAPFDWQPWNLELFWPESVPTYALTALGLAFAIWVVRGSRGRPHPFASLSGHRVLVAAALGCAYLVTPWVLRTGPEAADSHSVRTLQEREERVGKPVAFDRVWLERLDETRARIRLPAGAIEVRGSPIAYSARVSLRGYFIETDTVRLDEIHEHVGWRRDVASYLGLALIAMGWSAGLWPLSRRERAV